MTLSLLARGLSGSFRARWLILASLVWIVYSVNTGIEGAIFTTFAAVSVFTIVTFLGASLLCGAAVAWLFSPEVVVSDRRTPTLFASHSVGGWVWRLGAAWLAFPLIYLAFGWMVAPFVIGVYQQQQFELRAPGWEAILVTQALRSVLLLAVCLPVISTWGQSQRRLQLTLGWALFVLVGLLYMLQAHWMPPGFRLAHSLEILASSCVYAWVLVTLLWSALCVKMSETPNCWNLVL